LLPPTKDLQLAMSPLNLIKGSNDLFQTSVSFHISKFYCHRRFSVIRKRPYCDDIYVVYRTATRGCVIETRSAKKGSLSRVGV
jgi:hypothetical protein